MKSRSDKGQRKAEKGHLPAGRIKGVPMRQADIAALLGVTRQHLSLVRHGHRKSKSLLAKYNEIIRETT